MYCSYCSEIVCRTLFVMYYVTTCFIHYDMSSYGYTHSCAYMHTYILHTYIYIHIHSYIHTYIHTYIHARINTCIHAYTYGHAYTDASWMHVCLHTFTCTHTYIYMYMYMHLYIYIHMSKYLHTKNDFNFAVCDKTGSGQSLATNKHVW